MKICDLHTHVLPGIDDGAQNLEQALQMLQNAVASDVAYLAVTPHFDVSMCSASQLLDRMHVQFQKLQEAAASIPVELALGAEVRISPELMAQLELLRLPTLGGGQYLLTEFPRLMPEEQFVPVLEKLLRRDYIPLIAHPERYYAVRRHPEMARRWQEKGYGVQVNRDSLLGLAGEYAFYCADLLLRKGWANCIASDAHQPQFRSPHWGEAFRQLPGIYGFHTLAYCLETIPQRILENRPLTER